jgi:hypothetical protein
MKNSTLSRILLMIVIITILLNVLGIFDRNKINELEERIDLLENCKHTRMIFQYCDNRVKDQAVFWCPNCFSTIYINTNQIELCTKTN